ncbi:hypothetical protein [Nocardia asteroides]
MDDDVLGARVDRIVDEIGNGSLETVALAGQSLHVASVGRQVTTA